MITRKSIDTAVNNLIAHREDEEKSNNIYRFGVDTLNERFIGELNRLKSDLKSGRKTEYKKK